jgi:hypothetical protein
MSAPPTILIGRCSFWPEARDPEAWLRALVTLSNAAAKSGTQSWTSPRAVGDTVLRGHLSRRGVPGLFGPLPSPGGEGQGEGEGLSLSSQLLLGVGLLELSAPSGSQPPVLRSASDEGGSTLNPQLSWHLSADAQNLLTTWQTTDHRQAMEQLATSLLRRSAWLRLAALKFQSGAWQLVNWDKLKASNGQFRVGKTLLLGNDADPAAWLSGIEEPVLGAWWPQLSHESPVTVQIHAPKTAKPDDGLSLSPLKSPLYLLDSLGWLDATGRLRLPASLAHEPFLGSLAVSKPSATALLDQATAAFSDHRGVFPLERVMFRFAQALDVFPRPVANDSSFIAWTDALLTESFRTGAIELFSAEPGQSRHGRGLFGDPQQKLLRWRVHEGFDVICANVAIAFPQPETVISL